MLFLSSSFFRAAHPVSNDFSYVSPTSRSLASSSSPSSSFHIIATIAGGLAPLSRGQQFPLGLLVRTNVPFRPTSNYRCYDQHIHSIQLQRIKTVFVPRLAIFTSKSSLLKLQLALSVACCRSAIPLRRELAVLERCATRHHPSDIHRRHIMISYCAFVLVFLLSWYRLRDVGQYLGPSSGSPCLPDDEVRNAVGCHL